MFKINSNVILEENIKLKVEAKDWIDSMKKSGKLLVNSGFIKEGYIDLTIKNVEENGPYIVIAPGLALSHYRPDETVLKTGLSLITLTEPLNFNSENDPVDIVLTLASTSDDDHLNLLQKLSCYLSEDGKMDRIRNCTNPGELAKEINEYEVEF
ncbi:Ascorbate-specific PTS system EIIA component [Clostridium felsineum]|uniref:Ascorbate-specific PTS system EIIA component n=1 Tax=Clostridium felsineum TaxID=36839 RepID=A0A1S8MCE1_9CLOT|nr:Ascorbate-specific PTS system EIIA component [Clostridium felsineum]URZ04972.1 Ascorbate-specific PTS system EIIA component [Clostridium felsineum]URZ10013.1 Ascorbate-specific PTS system EIIA component [Clostridium felsineum]URZ18089.1 Ascorbate-specific PTS system EIIA component [Clostridium felsineum DSM 794]